MILNIDLACFTIKLCGEVAKLPLSLSIFGAVGNSATLCGAFAECVRV